MDYIQLKTFVWTVESKYVLHLFVHSVASGSIWTLFIIMNQEVATQRHSEFEFSSDQPTTSVASMLQVTLNWTTVLFNCCTLTIIWYFPRHFPLSICSMEEVISGYSKNRSDLWSSSPNIFFWNQKVRNLSENTAQFKYIRSFFNI